jgi:hypothetical protein
MSHWRVISVLFALGIAMGAQDVRAQSPAPVGGLSAVAAAVINAPGEPKQELKAGKVVRALRIHGAAPAIDGTLNDEIWNGAERLTGFVQRDPDNGQPMTEETLIQIAYDARFLYVAVTCVDREPALVAAGFSRRDEMGATDFITIGFDARHDHQTAYAFQTNPSAVQVDISFFNDESQDRDYNAVWDVRTARTPHGWTAEYRIPFSQMRFSAAPEPGQVWGFGASRQIRRRGEFGAWVPRPRGVRGEVSLWGHLVFDDPITAPRRLELTPYVGARSELAHDRARESGASAGLDARLGIGSGATLAGTFNPDFGQVEQDPAVLNLSVFETFFPEKRPFFLEDSRTFLPPYGNFQLFHSRRIGRAPGRLALAGGEVLLEKPDETTILGATKLTGKGSGWTYGAMTALTSREYAQVEIPVTQADGSVAQHRRERLIEPATSYNVGRIQRDVLNGSSNIGALVTAVFREQAEDAFTGGIDYSLRWDRNRTNFNGHWAVTRAPGTGGMKTSGGGVTNFNVSRKYLNVFTHYDRFGKDFRVNDIGFLRVRQNRNQANAGMEVFNPDPWKMFRRAGGGFSVSRGWTDARLVWQSYGEFWTFMQFRNFWNTNFGMFAEHEVLDDLDTRGGPPIVRPSYSGIFYNLSSDQRKSWRWNLYANRGSRSGGGWFSTVNTGLTVQLSDRVQTSFSTQYSFGHDLAQWITNVDPDGDGINDHVYGTLDRDVVDVTVRGTYAFSRDLTLQAYLQPFVAVGDYHDIRRLARPRSFDFDATTLTYNPDFSTKSLRGNIVMRWEYNPGSTLFFVWDLSQSDLSRPGEFRPLRDLRTAFGANASHVLMVKASYWLDR